MTNVKIIAVGSLKEGFLKEAVSEYKKKLSKYARIEEIEIPEERITDEGNSAQINGALSREGKKILAAIPDGAVKIALCIEGKQHSSEELAGLIEKGADRSGKLAFIIGSSHGLCDEVKGACDVKLSFSKMTFPHQLVRVMLLEAVYRSFTIIHGAKYHK